jgi:hypothetical protein
VFELSQTLREQWLVADYHVKRRILEIVCLNCRLDDATLVCEMRKPFDVLAEGLISKDSRGDRRLLFLNELDGLYLMRLAIAQSVELSAELFAR